MVLTCKELKKAFGINEILSDVSFILEEKEKAAIVGVNGAGKTTLFRILNGEYQFDDGELIIASGTRIGYLPQTAEMDSQNTIYGELETVFDDIREMEAEMRKLEKDMAILKDDALESAMSKYARLTQRFEERNGYEYESRLRGVIKGLGFSQAEWTQPVNQLSGGQKTRLALGKLLLTEPELLLLDEPTNHLDIESIQWLEDYLKSYKGSILIISHDRYFLDRTVTKIIEVENKKSTVYNGDYSFFAKKKVIDREIMFKHYYDQQKEIKRQEDIIKTLRSYNREKSVRRAESREKMLAKLERVEKPASMPDKMRLFLTPKRESGNDVLFLEDVGKSYDDQIIFKNMNLSIRKGEKVALIGPNGIGKTTLFKIIMNEIKSTTGIIRMGVNVIIGYYDQEHGHMDESKTILQELSDSYPRLLIGQIRNVLAAFVFTGDDVFKPISALSGGERGRVALAKIMLGGANFLILDEPTNHLDMFSREVLEEALRDFPGTALYISHDRYFINNTADTIIEMYKDGCQCFLGNYDFYIEKKAEEKKNAALSESTPDSFDLRQAHQDFFNPSHKQVDHKQISDATNNESSMDNDWARKKMQQSEERKRKTRFAKAEEQIASAEAELAELELSLEQEDVYTDPIMIKKLCEKRAELDDRLVQLYALWENSIDE